MNEISAPERQDSPQASRAAMLAYALTHSRVRTSDDQSQIFAAIARAQVLMTSPKRNKKVVVKPKDNGPAYVFKYATLDSVNDMIRGPLGQNGLAIMQPIVGTDNGLVLITKLIHESGQWIEMDVPLPRVSEKMQAFGGAVTFMRRYSVCSLLNIAADEDDDANSAVGNRVEDAPPEPPIPNVMPDHLNPIFRNLLIRARGVASMSDAEDFLDQWVQRLPELELLRRDPSWKLLSGTADAAISRLIGAPYAKMFSAPVRAAEASHIVVIDKLMEEKWRHKLAQLGEEWPRIEELLKEHIEFHRQRVLGLDGDMAAAEMAATPPAAAQVSYTPAPQTTATEPVPGPPPEPEAAPALAVHLIDAMGEVTSDEITDPLMFARAYATAWLACESEQDRENLANYNGDAISQVSADERARALIDDLSAGGAAPADLFVEPPRNSAGNIMLAGYLSAISASLAKTRAAHLIAWVRANEPIFGDLPSAARLQVMSRIAKRREALGLAPIA